ncbi:MAG: DUF4330 domain-containing protein [Clostridia bacterium]|nr:DUF4330 domain-containing protein [Clostridia bacterium]
MNGQQNNEYGNNNARSAKRRNGKRMNLVDWILVLVVLASVGVFVYFAFFSELDIFGSKEEKVSVQYTVRVEKVNAEMLGVEIDGESGSLVCDFIDTKDRVYDCDSGKAIGRVTSVKYESSYEPTGAVDQNGNLVYAKYPGHIDIVITVSGSGSLSDGIYSINGYEIRVGSDIEFRTEGYTALGKCVSVAGKEIAENDN